MNDTQRYLQTRLAEEYNAKVGDLRDLYRDKPETILEIERKIEGLRKVVRVWERQQERKRKRSRAKLDKARSTAREAIIFWKPADALKAVKAFEKIPTVRTR
jgi:vacuolar-type H+-ATPase subunit I/STV1